MRFHPDAAQEYFDALLEIETARPGFGRRFELQVQKKIQQATLFPKSGKRIARFDIEVRSFVLQRFPYTLIIAILEQTQQIVAVAHGKRHPDYWQNRLH